MKNWTYSFSISLNLPEVLLLKLSAVLVNVKPVSECPCDSYPPRTTPFSITCCYQKKKKINIFDIKYILECIHKFRSNDHQISKACPLDWSHWFTCRSVQCGQSSCLAIAAIYWTMKNTMLWICHAMVINMHFLAGWQSTILQIPQVSQTLIYAFNKIVKLSSKTEINQIEIPIFN